MRIRSVPDTTVIPVLAYADVIKAAEWLCRGHRWTLSQSIADVDPADWGGTAGGPRLTVISRSGCMICIDD